MDSVRVFIICGHKHTGYPVPTIIVHNLSPCIVFLVLFSYFFSNYIHCMTGRGVKVVFVSFFDVFERLSHAYDACQSIGNADFFFLK